MGIAIVVLLCQDLGKLGRDLRKVVIIDNSPASYIFNPDNAVSLICNELVIYFSYKYN